MYQNDTDDEESIADLFSNIYRTLLNIYQVKAVIYIGCACDDLLYINKSFESALQLLDVHSNNELDAHFLYIADKSVNFIRYCYSIQEQQKLINLILVNDLKGIDQLLQEIYDNNFKDQSLSASMQKLLYAQLVGTILNCNDDSSLASETVSYTHLDVYKRQALSRPIQVHS